MTRIPPIDAPHRSSTGSATTPERRRTRDPEAPERDSEEPSSRLLRSWRLASSSTPITACLVVLGRHVESLNFIELLLGDKPPLSPVQSFYQRILASDPDEVTFQAESLLKDLSLLDYCEQVALPGLALAQIDVVRGVMDRGRQVEICASVESVVADLSDHVDVANDEVAQAAPQLETPTSRERSASGSALCIAGRTPIDQAACTILAQLLEREHVPARVIGSEALLIGGPSRLNPDGVDALCIFYLGRQSLAVVRYSVRRLRKRFRAFQSLFAYGAALISPRRSRRRRPMP